MATVAAGASRYRWVILALTFVGQLSNALAAQAVAPLVPILQPELGLTKAQVGLFSSAAFAGGLVVLFLAGFLTDRFGVRRMMAAGQVATGAIVLAMSVATSFVQGVAVMFLAGVGRGATGPGVTKGVMDWFAPTARGSAMGVNQTAIPLAGILTAASLPALALALGWRSAIALVGLAVIAGGVGTAVFYREGRGPSRSVPRKEGFRSGLSQVVRNRRLWALCSTGPVLAAAQFAITTYLAVYFMEVVLVSSIPEESARIIAAGGFLALCHAGSVLARLVWGIISDRLFHGRRLVVMAVIGALATAMSVVMSSLQPDYPLWLLGVIVFAYGAAATGWQGIYLAAAGEAVGPRHAGAATGLSMTFTQVGYVAGPPAFGFVLDTTGSYQAAWLFLAALYTIGACVAAVGAGQDRTAKCEVRSAEC